MFQQQNLKTFVLPFSSLHFSNISGKIIVLITDGNSEIGAHVRSNLWLFLDLFRRLIKARARAAQIGFFFLRKDFLPACVLSYHLI